VERAAQRAQCAHGTRSARNARTKRAARQFCITLVTAHHQQRVIALISPSTIL